MMLIIILACIFTHSLLHRYYLVSGHVSMITESNTILRDFHGPQDYNINHLLLPASALLGCSFKNCITLKTNTDCEVIQFLFKVTTHFSSSF